MWFGDAVTLTEWPDIWLHEGFATFSEWIWSERHGGATAQQTFDQHLRGQPVPVEPGAGRARAPVAAVLHARSTTAAA